MNKEKYICPVCGYPNLNEGPMIFIVNNNKNISYQKGAPTFEICPCCGTEFGYDDDELSWEELRKAWIKKDARWFKEEKKPKEWDLRKQLLNLNKIESEITKKRKPN